MCNEIAEIQRIIGDSQSELVGTINDYKQSQNEIKVLNRQLERQTTSVNDLSDIVDTCHKVIDDLKKENTELKFRLKMLTKVHMNSIYGFCATVNYNETDSIKETKDNDDNN